MSYSPPSATVLVSAVAREALLEVSVHNDGPPISPDILPRFFERFYRGEPSSQRGGAGLGLTICRRLIEAHGGTIWAESDSGGVVFRFTLPAATEALT